MTPEKRERLSRLLNAAELGLKDAAQSLREADELLKDEPEAGTYRDQLRTYAVVADANRGGIERMEERVRRAGEGAPMSYGLGRLQSLSALLSRLSETRGYSKDSPWISRSSPRGARSGPGLMGARSGRLQREGGANPLDTCNGCLLRV